MDVLEFKYQPPHKLDENLWEIRGEGKKTRSNGISIPSDYNEVQAVSFLEDILHQRATRENPSIKIIEN